MAKLAVRARLKIWCQKWRIGASPIKATKGAKMSEECNHFFYCSIKGCNNNYKWVCDADKLYFDDIINSMNKNGWLAFYKKGVKMFCPIHKHIAK